MNPTLDLESNFTWVSSFPPFHQHAFPECVNVSRCSDNWLRRRSCVCLTLPGAARLSALANKDSETRSNFYILYIYIWFNSSTNPSPSHRVWIRFYTFPCGKGFKRGLQPELKSLFYMIFSFFFSWRNMVIFACKCPFEAWRSDNERWTLCLRLGNYYNFINKALLTAISLSTVGLHIFTIHLSKYETVFFIIYQPPSISQTSTKVPVSSCICSSVCFFFSFLHSNWSNYRQSRQRKTTTNKPTTGTAAAAPLCHPRWCINTDSSPRVGCKESIRS